MTFGPKARDKPAQGKRGTSAALGCWLVSDNALKGRHNFADGRHNFAALLQGFVLLPSISLVPGNWPCCTMKFRTGSSHQSQPWARSIRASLHR